MDQQNYELDQTGAEETPKKKKGQHLYNPPYFSDQNMPV